MKITFLGKEEENQERVSFWHPREKYSFEIDYYKDSELSRISKELRLNLLHQFDFEKVESGTK